SALCMLARARIGVGRNGASLALGPADVTGGLTPPRSPGRFVFSDCSRFVGASGGRKSTGQRGPLRAFVCAIDAGRSRAQKAQRSERVEGVFDVGSLVPVGASETSAGKCERADELGGLVRFKNSVEAQVLGRDEAGEGREPVGKRDSRI